MMFLTPDVSQEIWQAPLFEHCNKTRKLTKIALVLVTIFSKPYIF
jgi:hypothetical protein